MEIKMGKNITVYDIANEAGVSVATVSRVLNNNNKVAEITRQRVQGIIDKHDFKPNELARSLFKNETKMIGCILPDITNPYYSSVFIEAEKYALQLGYTLVLCDAMDKASNDVIYLQTLVERQVDGIIYMGRNSSTSMGNFEKQLEKYRKKLPIVMINWGNFETGCYRVQSKEAEGFELLIEELIKSGHKKISLIGGRGGVLPTDIKYEVFKKAVRRHGLEWKDNYRIEGDYTTETGFKTMNRILDDIDHPTAVMGINDMVSIGAVKACHMRNIRVPDDIVITGFDNIPLAHYIFPTLTTVTHDYKNIGKRAIDIITDKTIGNNTKLLYEYSMSIVKGESF